MCADSSGVNLPDYIDVLRLAQSDDEFRGVISLAKMERLALKLHDTDGKIQIKLKFGRDVEGLSYIIGHIQGKLPLVCQRCIQPMSHTIDYGFALSPVWTDEQARKLPNKYEALMLPEDEKVVLAELIEDELILQLPILVMHEAEDCQWQPSGNDDILEIETEKPNPFAALAVLKDFRQEKK